MAFCELLERRDDVSSTRLNIRLKAQGLVDHNSAGFGYSTLAAEQASCCCHLARGR
jgi:hypothetical protein